MNVTLACPACDHPAHASVDQADNWHCANCDQRLRLDAAVPSLPTCVVCGNHELYKKKDFPHWLGMTIVIAGGLLSTISYLWYEIWWTWSFLIGSAIIDTVLYLIVGDVIVCYHCQAHYRGATPTDAHQPFEITIGERYRQERIRQERLKNNTPGKATPS